MTIKRTVLSFVFDGDRLLMIFKKTGQGKGKWNVPGGKIVAGEEELAAAVRETREETGIVPVGLAPAGRLEFYFEAGGSWSNVCTVFVAHEHSGELIPETDECTATWISKDELPWDEMWESDRTWIPLVFTRKPFHRIYRFSADDKLLGEEIVE